MENACANTHAPVYGQTLVCVLCRGYLYGREKEGETKLLALYVPKELTTRIDRLAKDLKAKKREVILALLNEGLDRYHRSKGRRRPKKA
jgi:hypothetical protein